MWHPSRRRHRTRITPVTSHPMYVSQIHPRRKKKPRLRLKASVRLNRIENRIYAATQQGKPLSVRQLMIYERLGRRRIQFYVHWLRETRMSEGVRIQLIGGKLVWVRVKRELPPPPPSGPYELHGFLKYRATQIVGRRIEIDAMILLPRRDDVAVAQGMVEIQEMVRRRFSSKLASILEFSTLPATPQSRPYVRFRHGNEPNYQELL